MLKGNLVILDNDEYCDDIPMRLITLLSRSDDFKRAVLAVKLPEKIVKESGDNNETACTPGAPVK